MPLINYREGVSFEIPNSWECQDESSVQLTLFEDRPDSGTLRLSLTDFSGNDMAHRDELIATALEGHVVEHFGDGLLLGKRVTEGQEGGELLKLHRWVVTIPVTSERFRTAIFTHTIVAGQETDPLITRELALVDKSIRNAQYSRAADLPLLDSV